MFFGLAVGHDSRGASIHDSPFIVLYLVFGVGFLVGLRFAFRSFRRALRSPRLDSQAETGQALNTLKQPEDAASPDERLAHLVKGLHK